MDMTNRVPDWLTPISWLYIALALISAAAIAVDIYARHRRHTTVAEEVVWIASALYLGPFALPLYARHGRAPARAMKNDAAVTTRQGHDQPIAVAGLPGGGASAIAHLLGVPLVLASGLTIAGIDLWVMIIVIGVLAMAFLFAYERAATRPGRTLPVGTAATAAVLTVLAFDIGMGGWMLLLHFNSFMPPATEGNFWFLMQVGIVLGLLTAYPVVNRLTRRHQTLVPA
ncbi:hypothetical protein ENKNEFLB_01714 [Nocardioides aquaticus]|uniref:DUF4396 domain-containing protein n=1 Tax=Nocardioides aquaticus TaxID=160826 RepID=A0ABX8EFP6_9ACTN|nr:DUF4396 domain-containing protein [Nocardioides aquaticus]QVT79333.1 hypothetical protein ENKNEFLB_01714 [Nocardioides aquaticus]